MTTQIRPDADSREIVTPPPANGTAQPGATGGGKRSPLPFILGALLLLGGFWTFRTLRYASTHESTDNATIDGHVLPVLAKVGGFVTAVHVGENDRVRADSVLVVIDDREYTVRLAQADADLAAARAATGGNGLGTGQAQAMVASASAQTAVQDANVDAARAQVVKAEADLARFSDLAAKNIVSQQQLDAAKAQAAATRAQLVAVQRQATAAGANVTGMQAGVRLAEARLNAATAARDNAALQLSFTRITASSSGAIAKKMVEVGQLVQPGQMLMNIASDTGLFITANFKETQLEKLRVGQPVELEVDAYDGARIEGVIESISAATGARFTLLPPDNASGNFTKVVQRVPARIRITKGLDAARPLRIGLSVVAHVVTK
ncbi:MAG TPA: HlyD family secretion protein [Gemmatimonadaceae bacterium]|nr:HlyD family secretion protein [Gemmatimonadaceae bacterium]